MIVARLVIAVALVAAAPAAAQTHDPAMHAMPGMTMSPSQSADVPAAAAVQSAPATDAATQPPPAPTGLAAERLYPPGAMDAAYAAMLQEHGGMPAYMLLFNIAEYQVRNGSDGLTLSYITVTGHAQDGMRVDTNAPFSTFHHLTAYANTGRGIFIDGPIAGFIR